MEKRHNRLTSLSLSLSFSLSVFIWDGPDGSTASLGREGAEDEGQREPWGRGPGPGRELVIYIHVLHCIAPLLIYLD